MKIKNCKIVNFGSYSELEFDYSMLGLSLIYGATGSGKSTLLDAPAWILFGITAKDGNVDDVRNWSNLLDPTQGTLEIEIRGSNIHVTRIRGKVNQNDLYWTESGNLDSPIRGKDITETQKLLESRIGVNKDTFILGSYCNEFNPVSTFFTSKAKDRRDLFETLVNMDFPVKISLNSTTLKKQLNTKLNDEKLNNNRLSIKLDSCLRSKNLITKEISRWKDNQTSLIEEYTVRKDKFQQEKHSKIQALTTKSDCFDTNKSTSIDDLISKIEKIQSKLSNHEESCTKCGQPDAHYNKLFFESEKLKTKLETIASSENPYISQIEAAKLLENHYEPRIVEEQNKANPFIKQLAGLDSEIPKFQENQIESENNITILEHQIGSLTHIYQLSFVLRGELLKKITNDIQNLTNSYLEKYFDSEISVSFVIEDSDSLQVTIQCNGYECYYRQLSKGQRCLLKLCFSIAIMNIVSKNKGIHFETLLFDEALDGMDSSLKVKAFNLFNMLELEHTSILLIDHAEEFQNLFSKKFYTDRKEDTSTLIEG